MKSLIVGLATVAAALTVGLSDADARRMGGGGSVGKQSSGITRQATPPQQGAGQAAQPGSQQSAASARTPGAQQPAAGNRWMGPLAGLAAGLGLAALASWLGFGEGLATLMLVLLMAAAAFFVLRLFLGRRNAAQTPQPAYAGAGAGAGAGSTTSAPTRFSELGRDNPMTPAMGGGAAGAAAAGSAAVATSPIPAGFDVDGFVRNAKVYFVRLQAAYDAADLNDLREFTSPQMFAELKMEIDERKGAPNVTEVVTLEAEMLGVEDLGHEQMASVRFTGMIREAEGATAEPFDEIWNFTRALQGGGWVLGGIQQTGSAAAH